MSAMDAFNNDAFSMRSLTGTVEQIDYIPSYLGSLNIFEDEPVRTSKVFVDRRESQLRLIPTTPRGSDPAKLTAEQRSAVPLDVPRLAKDFTLFAHEVDGIRAFGAEDFLMDLQVEYLRRMARLRNDMELTMEHHRMGALQGVLLDADGTTVIYDFYEEFGIAKAPVFDFELDVDTTDVRVKANTLRRDLIRRSGGVYTMQTSIRALCGDDFWDQLTGHPNVEKYYLQHAGATELRDSTGAFTTFRFGGIDWTNYRGTDDNTTIGIPDNQAKIFPVGATGVFKRALAPAEFGPYVNTLGLPLYAMNLLDPSGRQAFTKGELYSYPLHFCQRPEALQDAVAS